MSNPITIQLAQRGVLTLPKTLREQYSFQPGDQFTLIDLDGVFVLSPQRSQVDYLANQVAKGLAEQGETLESMMLALREEREQYDADS